MHNFIKKFINTTQLFLWLLLIMLSSVLHGQIDKTNTWYFGRQIGIEFSPNIKVLNGLVGSDYVYEGTGIWNDKAGKVLFYADWMHLFNGNNDTINRDFHLGSNGTACQPVILTSVNDTLLYAITSNPNNFGSKLGPGGYTFSEYNMISKTWPIKRKVLRPNSSECQTLVNHQNGQWQWVVSHSLLGDTLFSYLINEEGLETCPIISHAGPHYPNSNPGQGVMKFSPDGKYLFIATWNLHFIVACSFNNQTGEIKELFRFKNFDYYPYGIEIDDNNLFVSMGRPRDIIYQYALNKMDSTSVLNSRKTLFDTTEFDKIGQIQMAPDGNMYVNEYEKNFLGKISRTAKDKYSFAFTPPLFGTKVGYGGFPNFNASYFYQPALDFIYKHICHSHAFSFTAKDTFTANSFTWNMSKGNTKETRTGKTLNYTFLETGLWKVQLIASNGLRTDTIEKEIEVFTTVPQGFLGADHYYTQGQMVQGNLLAPAKQHCSHWWRLGDTLETTGSIYTYTDTGTYVCKTTNKHFCHRWDTVQVKPCDSIPTAILSRVKDTLFLSQTATHIYWYKNGAELPANRNQTRLTLNAEGNYHVVLINAQGCADSSNLENIAFLYAGLKLINKQGLFIYPNPNTGEFTIKGIKPNAHLSITDRTGREVLFKQKGSTVRLNQNSKGPYYLILAYPNKINYVPIIVE